MTNPILESSQSTLDTQQLDLDSVRTQFPSLLQHVNGQPSAFLDGPGGTQVPQRVIDAISDIHEEDCTLNIDDLASKINPRTKLVAVGYASNAVGTINDVKKIVRLAHDAGAMAFIDAVHYAPHGPIDVRELDCDFLACSTYKFFGPHMGVLYGKREHLTLLQPHKLRANTNAVPQRSEWGTINHECI